jgi:hypothetical protein
MGVRGNRTPRALLTRVVVSIDSASNGRDVDGTTDRADRAE